MSAPDLKFFNTTVGANFIKSSRCPKLDGYAIANFGVRVEREVVKMMHYGCSSGEMEWSSGVV